MTPFRRSVLAEVLGDRGKKLLTPFRNAFRRTRKGNLSCVWEGRILTVFRRASDDSFAWSIAADDEGVRYSPGKYEDEEDALDALVLELDL